MLRHTRQNPQQPIARDLRRAAHTEDFVAERPPLQIRLDTEQKHEVSVEKWIDESFDWKSLYEHDVKDDPTIANDTVDEHSAWAIYLGADPRLDPLRAEARFPAILARAGVPGGAAAAAQLQQ